MVISVWKSQPSVASHGWAKAHALHLYAQALELLPEDDPRRRSIRLQRVVIAQALQHLLGEDVGRPTGGD